MHARFAKWPAWLDLKYAVRNFREDVGLLSRKPRGD
jgi:hypothetical protein